MGCRDVNSKLRKEKYKQKSSNLPCSKIPILKEENYYVKEIPLDGEAPKEYICAYFYYKNCPRKSDPTKWNGFYA